MRRRRQLLVRLKPKSDESLMSYVLRLTEQNGYDTPAWILMMAGLRYGLKQTCAFVFKPAEALAGLAEVTGDSIFELASLTYPQDERSDVMTRSLFYGHSVSQHVICAARPKVCPRCLSETGYCRRIWDFLLVTTCPVHKCVLLNRCPQCGWRITWVRHTVSTCRMCGFDWRDYLPPKVEDTELKVTLHVYKLCGLPTPQNSPGVSDAKNPVLNLALEYFTQAILFIAGQYLTLTSLITLAPVNPTNTQITAVPGVNFHALFMKIFSIFEIWPKEFHSFLDWREDQRVGTHRQRRHLKSGTSKKYGEIYTVLHRKLNGAQFAPIRRAYSTYIREHRQRKYDQTQQPVNHSSE